MTCVLAIGVTSLEMRLPAFRCPDAVTQCQRIYPTCQELLTQTIKACVSKKTGKPDCKAPACVKSLARASKNRQMQLLFKCSCDKSNQKKKCNKVRDANVPCPPAS